MIGPEDGTIINQIENVEEWLKGKLRSKLQKNGLCMAILDREKVVGFNLATTGEGLIELLKLKIITKSDEAWSEQITINKDYRRRGLANLLRNHFYEELRNKGIQALYGHRQEFNIASKGSARKYTSTELGIASYLKVLRYHRLFIKKNRLSDYPASSGNQKFSLGRNRKDKEFPFIIQIDEFKSIQQDSHSTVTGPQLTYLSGSRK